MVVRITVMILRVTALLALILGILVWARIGTGLVLFHMLLGIIVTLSLWILGAAIATRKNGNIPLGTLAVVLGLLMVALGLTQTTLFVGTFHWAVQVLHLLFGLLAIGLGEMIAARYKRIPTTEVVA